MFRQLYIKLIEIPEPILNLKLIDKYIDISFAYGMFEYLYYFLPTTVQLKDKIQIF